MFIGRADDISLERLPVGRPAQTRRSPEMGWKERERKRDSESEREGEKERGRKRVCAYVSV